MSHIDVLDKKIRQAAEQLMALRRDNIKLAEKIRLLEDENKAVKEMFGQGGDAAISMPAPARLAASLVAEGRSLATAPPPAYPLRFVASETGCNDASDDPQALHILRLRYDHTVAETLGIIARSWSRRKPFADDFESPKLGLDWAAAWGSVSTAHHRLSLSSSCKATASRRGLTPDTRTTAAA